MASSEGFLTDEQRKMLEVAIETGNTEVFSSSPRSPSVLKSPTRLMASRPIKAPANYNSTTEITVRHVRRTHSGKYVRVKKVIKLLKPKGNKTARKQHSRYNLMAMNFCQMRGIALVLHHESMNTFKVKIGEEIRGFREHNSGDMANKTNNRMTLFELLKSFFCYWAREYNYCDDVVSVRMGKTIRRKESQCAGNAWKETIVIEDPFVITKNVCFHLDPNQLEKMRKEFAIAAQLLERSAKSWIDKYRPSFI